MAVITDETLSLDALEPENQYVNCELTYSNQEIRVEAVSFEKCRFQQTDFKNSEWLDCTFRGCQFLNCEFQQSYLYRCEFTGCQLLGSDFTSARLKDVTITDSRADYANFAEAVLTGVTFTETRLVEASFQMMTVKRRLDFNRCELNRADFTESRLKLVDLRTSQIEAITFTPGLVRGCKIDPLQAVTFAAALGLDIQA
ncbi:pentapeptide repeat-containing protein [Levilactobacillus tujiorum]|uniref:pentapeptide repeat-containing protein n=1 Tax=Levilactobacillus tujiorum TaxID=2912243 RepID=UPI001456BAEF|nr:pentapeptide repeat-containing protein [Levilactobacillus tujiorum]NLR30982.1 pentapeptide repeat-containing protein [Levilactobacillus tujiorum]